MTDTFPVMPARLEYVEGLPAGNKRGKALERLVSEMLAAVPGLTIAASNVIPGTGQAEFDIVLTNKTSPDGLDALDGFGRDVLVECKSSDTPLGSRDVTHFLNQARIRHSDWSILVSLAGITGDGDDVVAANSAVPFRHKAATSTRMRHDACWVQGSDAVIATKLLGRRAGSRSPASALTAARPDRRRRASRWHRCCLGTGARVVVHRRSGRPDLRFRGRLLRKPFKYSLT